MGYFSNQLFIFSCLSDRIREVIQVSHIQQINSTRYKLINFHTFLSIFSIMGQGDELGILPRFCEELFERIKCWNEVI